MTREQMVEKARDEISAWENECGCPIPGDLAESIGRSVLDAILPQISTVAELESLPWDSVVHGLPHGDVWQSSGRGWDCLSEDGSAGTYFSASVARQAPLTVVWQPEADEVTS